MFGLKEEHIEAINSCFARFPEIRKVVVYGSRAMGSYKKGSDIDLTIIETGMNLSDFLKIENQLDDLMLPYKIDLSLKKNIDNPDLLDHIEQVGRIFYKRKYN